MHSRELFARSEIAEIESASRRDEEVVTAIRAGSDAAFEKLQKRYSHRLYRRIFSIIRNREDAEDVLQDTFLRAFLRIDSFEGKSQLFTWLTSIAINSALMCLRKRRRRVEVSLQEQSESGEEIYSFDVRDTALNPEEICALEQRFTCISGAIERLNPKLRTALSIWISTEGSMKEIAQTLDVSIASVKARLHRARKRLANFQSSTTMRGYAPHRTARPSFPDFETEKNHV